MNKKMLVVWSLFFLAGCATKGVNQDYERNREEAQHHYDQSKATNYKPNSGFIQKEGYWIDGNYLDVQERPDIFSKDVTLILSGSITLPRAAQEISRLSGIPVDITKDALEALYQSSRATSRMLGSNTQQQSNQASDEKRAQDLMDVLSKGAIKTSESEKRLGMTLNYTGSFEGLLNVVSSKFGISWTYADHRIRFFKVETRSFILNIIPGSASVVNNVESSTEGITEDGGSDMAGSTSTSGQKTVMDAQIAVMDSIKKAVDAMLSNDGKAALSTATGVLSVTDIPSVLDRIDRYIRDENARLSRQVDITIRVYSVALNNQDAHGLDWNVIYQSLVNDYGLSLATGIPFGADQISNVITGSILDGSDFSGSQVMVKLLSEQGKVSTLTEASVNTLNMQPVPIQVVRQTSYLKSAATTLAANVGSTASLEPGTITTGFTLNVLPVITGAKTLMMQMSVNLSDLERINDVESGGSKIQTPIVQARNFLQRFRMRSSETLVIAGFQQDIANITRSGSFAPFDWIMGGRRESMKNNQVIVILVTPTIYR